MDILQLYDTILDENIELHLVGDILCEDDYIKWEYDALGKTDENMETHLEETYENDKEILIEFLLNKNLNNSFNVNNVEIFDSSVIFFISEE